ncbi:hypothetical protein CKA32_006366 [Geitlerinema sp. FC II]|nr:hypothetical protein CKA32_006366 [Geitlerinema sp. FC II]
MHLKNVNLSDASFIAVPNELSKIKTPDKIRFPVPDFVTQLI